MQLLNIGKAWYKSWAQLGDIVAEGIHFNTQIMVQWQVLRGERDPTLSPLAGTFPSPPHPAQGEEGMEPLPSYSLEIGERTHGGVREGLAKVIPNWAAMTVCSKCVPL